MPKILQPKLLLALITALDTIFGDMLPKNMGRFYTRNISMRVGKNPALFGLETCLLQRLQSTSFEYVWARVTPNLNANHEC